MNRCVQSPACKFFSALVLRRKFSFSSHTLSLHLAVMPHPEVDGVCQAAFAGCVNERCTDAAAAARFLFDQ